MEARAGEVSSLGNLLTQRKNLIAAASPGIAALPPCHVLRALAGASSEAGEREPLSGRGGSQRQTAPEPGNAAPGALIFSSLAAPSLRFILAPLFLLTASAEGLREEDGGEEEAASPCDGKVFLTQYPRKRNLFPRPCRPNQGCEGPGKESEARALPWRAAAEQSRIRKAKRGGENQMWKFSPTPPRGAGRAGRGRPAVAPAWPPATGGERGLRGVRRAHAG